MTVILCIGIHFVVYSHFRCRCSDYCRDSLLSIYVVSYKALRKSIMDSKLAVKVPPKRKEEKTNQSASRWVRNCSLPSTQCVHALALDCVCVCVCVCVCSAILCIVHTCRILGVLWPSSLLMLRLLHCVMFKWDAKRKSILSCHEVTGFKVLLLIFPLEAWDIHTSSLNSVTG